MTKKLMKNIVLLNELNVFEEKVDQMSIFEIKKSHQVLTKFQIT